MKQHLVNESLEFFESFGQEQTDNDWYMDALLIIKDYIAYLEQVKSGLTVEEIRDQFEEDWLYKNDL